MSYWPSGHRRPRAHELLHCVDEKNGNIDVFTLDDASWPTVRNIFSNLPLHIVQIHAVSIHRGEVWPRHLSDGKAPKSLPGVDNDPCKTVGHEFSGIVVSTSPRSPLKPGTEVYGRTSFLKEGSARTYAVATFHELAPRPYSWSWAECAAMPIGGLVAFQALFSYPLLREPALSDWGSGAARKRYNGKVSLLITGAASPAGVWAIQLAKLAGVHRIVGICGAEHKDYICRMGATLALDWAGDGSLKSWTSGSGALFTTVLDLMGGPMLERAWRVVREGGKLLSVARDTASHRPAVVNPNILHYNFVLSNCPRHLRTLAYLADEGLLMPVLTQDEIADFAEPAFALQKLQKSRRGQVVLTLKPGSAEFPIRLLQQFGRKWEDANDFSEQVVTLSRGEDACEEFN